MNLRDRLFTKETGGNWVTVYVALAALHLVVALAMTFFATPVEATMGIAQKIFYFHVPSAIACYVGFTVCCAASVVYLINGSKRADVIARAGAELGVLFCAAVLISGPLWARKAWGTWWTGEPRLLLTLVLWLIFVAYLVVRQVGGPSEMTRKICAVLAILGVADIPLIRSAVERWRGNHPQVLRNEGGGITPEMMQTFVVMASAIGVVFLGLLLLRVRVGVLEEDVETWHRAIQPRKARLDDLERGLSKNRGAS